MNRQVSVGNYLDLLIEGCSKKATPPLWPPDVFALASSLLELSGGYCVVSCNWPPRADWASDACQHGATWRKTFAKSCPSRVVKLWEKLLESVSLSLSQIQGRPDLCTVLIELLAISDEASMGAGVPFTFELRDGFDFRADFLLATSNNSGGANLCDEVRLASVRVLPKMHVPQSGLNLRSFSHHLALITTSEIKPFWLPGGVSNADRETLDLLLLPWPLKISAKNFRQVGRASRTMKNLPENYGFFEYQRDDAPDLINNVLETVQKIATKSGKPDVVVMPEGALTDSEFDQLSNMLYNQEIHLIAGVAGKKNGDGTTQNCVRFNIPLMNQRIPVSQPKHHRWKLERNQIETYGLNLPKTRQLWEHIPIKDRSLSFICVRDWLALCVLICEDLARPDPVGDLIRAVGPNLVIALLLDGPQLEGRWSGRYATALADDPGSSVLTLTSRGMTALSNPPGHVGAQRNVGKIALWKDIRGKSRVIDIGTGDAAFLHIRAEEREEWTVDGRSNEGATGYPLLKSYEIFKNGSFKKRYDVDNDKA